MAKYYEIQQTNATGNGSSTTPALVTDPTFEGMGIRATKVGAWDGRFDGKDEYGNFQYMYRHIQPVDFMIIGNATCIERKHPFSDLNVE